MNNLKLHLKGLKTEIDKKIGYHLYCVEKLKQTDYDTIYGKSEDQHQQAIESLQDVNFKLQMILNVTPTTDWHQHKNDPNDSWDPPQW